MATVTITSPDPGATVAGVVTIHVDAPGVQKMNFYVDGVLKGRDTSNPFKFDWYTERYNEGKHVIKAVTGNGKSSAAMTVNVKNAVVPPSPLTKPGAPTGFAVVSFGSDSVTLRWDASPPTEMVDLYQVYVNDESNNLAVTQTGYTVRGLTPGTSYGFRVSAHNASGYGGWTASIAVTTRTPLGVTIVGVPKVGNTLTAVVA